MVALHQPDNGKGLKILYLCSSWPCGGSFGGQIRALHVARILGQLGRVTVLLIGSEAGDRQAMAETAAEFDVERPILPIAIKAGWLNHKLRLAFDTRYMNVHGYVASSDDQARLNALVERFDLVWILNARTPNIVHRWKWERAHLDLDDIPSTYSRSFIQSSTSWSQRVKAQALQRVQRAREKLMQNRFSTLSVCSHADRVYLGGGERIHVIPNGFQPPAHNPIRRLIPDSPRIGFIGLFSYTPNLDGVRWFLANCWPSVRQVVPGIRLRLVGKDTDGPLRPTDPNVDALGWVDNPASEIATWSAMIIPIRLGGGTRIKLAEAFSRKCPVVSTRLGAFGYEVTNGKHLFVADRPDDFVRNCITCVREPESATKLADNAWAVFHANWTWDAIAPKIHAAASDCLQKSLPNGT
jgi:glycosyltransferase involved in cell wall biosynthesis